jgi:type IV secretory pathway VirB10-like protein
VRAVSRKHVVYAIASFALLGWLLWSLLHISTEKRHQQTPAAAVDTQPPVEPPATQPSAAEPPAATPEDGDVHPPLLDDSEPPPKAFESIDLDAARAALPDNSYWDTAAPTTDPRLLGDRERADQERNAQYGRILSGDASDADIKEFFDRRMRLSSDYVRFVDWVLEHQGSKLSDQDLELLHVAKRLHLARLEEIPRRMQEAIDRKAKQDAARAAWRAEQREFDEGDSESQPPGEGGPAPNATP